MPQSLKCGNANETSLNRAHASVCCQCFNRLAPKVSQRARFFSALRTSEHEELRGERRDQFAIRVIMTLPSLVQRGAAQDRERNVRLSVLRQVHFKALKPKPQTPNHKPQTPNPQPFGITSG